MNERWIKVSNDIANAIIKAGMRFNSDLVETALRQYLKNVTRARRHKDSMRNNPDPAIRKAWRETRRIQGQKYRSKNKTKEDVLSTMDSEEKEAVVSLLKEEKKQVVSATGIASVTNEKQFRKDRYRAIREAAERSEPFIQLPEEERL